MEHRQPNLIYIFADQLRQRSLGYAGDDLSQTPNINKLCTESLNICNAVSGHPVCAPYRASLFTGKYTTSTGMVINEIRLNPNHRCFAHVLNENNYTTSYIGKWHMYADEFANHYASKNSYVPQGPDRLGFDGFFAHYGFHHDYYGAAAYYHLNSPDKIYHNKYEPDSQTDMAVNQIEQLSKTGKPFALFLSFGTPHDPWTPENVPGEYLERFGGMEFRLPPNFSSESDPYSDNWGNMDDKKRSSLTEWMRVYYAMIANLDDNIGRLMDSIERFGLEDDTIIVFTSDHGELFGAHGRLAKNIFYEEAVRVPFLIKWNGALDGGSESDIPLNTVDIMPTLLSMMDLPIPDTVEGRDFSKHLLEKISANDFDGALMMGTGATAVFEDGHEWRGFRTKQFTYAQYRVDGKELLFDNLDDPFQMKNLSDEPDYAETKQILRINMKRRMASVGDYFEPCSYYERNWVGKRRIVKQDAHFMEPA